MELYYPAQSRKSYTNHIGRMSSVEELKKENKKLKETIKDLREEIKELKKKKKGFSTGGVGFRRLQKQAIKGGALTTQFPSVKPVEPKNNP